jgi:hypothetical protein
MREQDYQFKIQVMDPKPLIWWKSRRTKIDMDPPYQRRGRLWSNTDKAYLIDSIINGFDVPKLYMADFTWGESGLNKSRLPYAIIDGKQRFEAIFDFFDGNVSLNDDFVYRADRSLKLGGLSYKDLQSNYLEIAELFETFALTVVGVVANSEEPITELFVRLNRSKSLTGAEVRNAMVGKTPGIIREIARHEFFETNIAFPVKRGADLNAAAKLLVFEFNEKPVETKKQSLDEFVSTAGAQGRPKLELAARRVFDILEDMSSIFLPKDKLLANGGILPVYYWFVRECDESNYHNVREFLVDFEGARKSNRGLGRDEDLDGELVEFDNLNRSTNDLRSQVRRIEILNRRFRLWLRERGRARKKLPLPLKRFA